MSMPLYRRTIKTAVSLQGVGLHSGQMTTLTLRPHDDGIIFVRTDLNATIPMDAFLVNDTLMSSNLIKEDVKVGTIEHLLAAVAAFGIDDLIIEVDAAEIPIMDGSSKIFMQLIAQAGLVNHPSAKEFIKITKPIEVANGDKWAKISPYEGGFFMDFAIDFDHQAIKSTPQQYRFDFGSQNFADEIASARTFGFLKDLHALQYSNLAQGASFDNVIVLDDDRVVNENGLRFADEFIRHKILDALGDLYVAGRAILGHFSAYKSGHSLNNALIRTLLNDPNSYEIVIFYDKNACQISYFDPKNSDDGANEI